MKGYLNTIEQLNIWVSLFVFILISSALLIGSLFEYMNFESCVKSVLGLISAYFVFSLVLAHVERIKLIQETRDQFSYLIESVGVLRIIKSPDEYYELLQGSIEQAKTSISLLYLTKQPPTNIGGASVKYWEWFQNYMKDRSHNVLVRRIASLDNEEKIKWVAAKTKELLNRNNYGLKGFCPTKHLPLIGLEIIDRSKVFIFGPHGTSPRWLYINNPDIAEGMAQYFDSMWCDLNGHEIKRIEETTISSDEIDERIKAICKSELCQDGTAS